MWRSFAVLGLIKIMRTKLLAWFLIIAFYLNTGYNWYTKNDYVPFIVYSLLFLSLYIYEKIKKQN